MAKRKRETTEKSDDESYDGFCESLFLSQIKDRNAMKLRLSENRWRELRLDEPERYRLALAAFYMGMGIEEVKDLLASPRSSNSIFVLDCALLMGLNDEDRIERVFQ